MKLVVVLASVAACAATAAYAKDDYVYGPAPDWMRYKQIGEVAVRAALPDQANWRVEWPNGYLKTGWRHNVRGYATCGVLRATGPVTSHNPLTDFVIVIDNDTVKAVDIATSSAASVVTQICRSMVQQGQIPPASLMRTAPAATSSSGSDMPVASLGLVVRAVPEGAYVVSAAPGSAAAGVGLVAGTIVTRVNGIALAGLGDTVARLLSAETPVFTIDTAAGGHLSIKMR